MVININLNSLSKLGHEERMYRTEKSNVWFQASAMVYMKSAFILDVTHCILVVTDVLRQPTSPIFKGQVVQEECNIRQAGTDLA
jgi:hypothetical protein